MPHAHKWLCWRAFALHWSCNKADGWSLLLTSDLHHLHSCFTASQESRAFLLSCPMYSLLRVVSQLPFSFIRSTQFHSEWVLNEQLSFLFLIIQCVSRAYVSGSFLLFCFDLILTLALPPICCGCILQLHPQAMCGIELWVGIWHPLITLWMIWSSFFIEEYENLKKKKISRLWHRKSMVLSNKVARLCYSR